MEYHQDGLIPTNDEIWVFGSNEAGRHGKGAALIAKQQFGAVYGVGFGRTGASYAIPTKGRYLQILSLTTIAQNISTFIEYATAHPELQFFVTAVGTGYAGYSAAQIAPLFANSPGNCSFPEEWSNWL